MYLFVPGHIRGIQLSAFCLESGRFLKSTKVRIITFFAFYLSELLLIL